MTVRLNLWCGVGMMAALLACSSEDTEGSSSSNSGTTSSSTSTANGGSTSSADGGNTSSANGGNPSTGGNATSSGGGGSGGTVNPGDTVRIIAIGDTGEGNTDQHCLAHAMSAKCLQDGCDAVLLAGDNFYDEGVVSVDDVQWMEKFELPYDRPGLNGLPFYMVLGNHDYSPAALKLILDHDGDKDAQIAYSSLPVGDGTMPGMRHSAKWTLPAAYYDVVLGNGMLHLFGLDGQDATSDQLNDMSQRVSGSTATWKLVFNHFPRYTSGRHQTDMDILNFALGLSGPNLYELLQGVYCNADIFLSGHDHDREYMTAGQDSSCPNTHFIVSGAGAKVTNPENTSTSNQVYFDNSIEGFFYLVFEGNQITIESYDKVNMADTQLEADCAPAGLAVPAHTSTILK